MKSQLKKTQIINFTAHEDKPEYGKTYSLTGKTSVAAGNTWKESEVKEPVMVTVKATDFARSMGIEVVEFD